MTDYYSIPTTLGAAKIAAAANVNQALTITHMAFGDANGLPYLPVSRVNSTTLLNERHRVVIEYLNQDSANANVYIIKARIPANIGGFEVNEIGLFDSDGDLIYLANYPRTLKSQITQGAGGELNVKIHIMTSHSSVLTIVLNPNVITLTQENGDGRYALKTELEGEVLTRENNDLALAISLAAEITNRIDNASYNVSPNGYVKLPHWLGGLIIQWGQESVSHDIGAVALDDSISFGFAFGFTNACLIAVPTIISDEQTNGPALAALQDCAAQIHSITQYGLKVLVQEWTPIVQNLRVGYIAIGY